MWQVVGDMDQGQYVALSKNRHHMVWLHEYTRDNGKGVDRTWTLGPLKFKTRGRIIQWAGAYRDMVGKRFPLTDFVEAFALFAESVPGITVTAPVTKEATSGNWCPWGADTEPYRIQLRGLLTSEAPVEGVVQSVMAVMLHYPKDGARKAAPLVMYRLWNCWAQTVAPIQALILAWDSAHPNATVRAVEKLVRQIRLPEADVTMTEEEVRAQADTMNLEEVEAEEIPPPDPF
jgi:hypothetical protein